MFEFLKKLFGVRQEQNSGNPGHSPKNGSRQGKKKKTPPQERKEKSPRKSVKTPRSERKKNMPCDTAVPAAAPAAVVEHPAELREIPPAEGKTRFLDLPLHREVQFGVQHAGFEYCSAQSLPSDWSVCVWYGDFCKPF